MEDKSLHKPRRSFEELRQSRPDGSEYWSARDLMIELGYSNWRNFRIAIDRAIESATTSGIGAGNHFVGVNKLVTIGSRASREVDDIELTRLACYLIAQNGDPRKTEIAAAQTYFAVQTRKQEVVDAFASDFERLEARAKLKDTQKELHGNLYQRNVRKPAEIAQVHNTHDKAIYGGMPTKKVKERMGAPLTRPLADFEPTVILKAKDLSLALSNENINKKDLSGRVMIEMEVEANGKAIRRSLVERGYFPEKKTGEEDIKKLERRVKRQVKLGDIGAQAEQIEGSHEQG